MVLKYDGPVKSQIWNAKAETVQDVIKPYTNTERNHWTFFVYIPLLQN